MDSFSDSNTRNLEFTKTAVQEDTRWILWKFSSKSALLAFQNILQLSINLLLVDGHDQISQIRSVESNSNDLIVPIER